MSSYHTNNMQTFYNPSQLSLRRFLEHRVHFCRHPKQRIYPYHNFLLRNMRLRHAMAQHRLNLAAVHLIFHFATQGFPLCYFCFVLICFVFQLIDLALTSCKIRAYMQQYHFSHFDAFAMHPCQTIVTCATAILSS